jgi:uncharacterized protein (DUF952 family)
MPRAGFTGKNFSKRRSVCISAGLNQFCRCVCQDDEPAQQKDVLNKMTADAQSTTVTPALVFKVSTKDAWDMAGMWGVYTGSADDRRDGFIHLSAPHQVSGTLAKYFRGQSDLVIVAFEVQGLANNLKWEASRGGDLFPHYYGNLPATAALWSRPLDLGPEGYPVLDEGWLI